MPNEPDAPAFNVIERSSHYFLSQDDEGFALWSVKGDDAGPVLRSLLMTMAKHVPEPPSSGKLASERGPRCSSSRPS